MKFKFCGDNDCQDWLLAQINLLSKLTSIKIKIVLNEVVKHLLTGELDFDKICKLTNDAKMSEEETKAVVAALNFILTSASKYSTDSEILSNELQQLGLPKEHSQALCKVYSDNVTKLNSKLKEQSLKFNALKSCSYEIQSKFSDGTIEIECPSVILDMKGQAATRATGEPTTSTKLYVTIEKLDCLISDLKEVLHTMENVNI